MDLLTTLSETLHKASEQQKALADAVSSLQQENASLRTRMSSGQVDTVEQLIFDNHLKQARIEILERQLLSLQTKCRRWKRTTMASSPLNSTTTTLYSVDNSVRSQSSSPTARASLDLHWTPSTKIRYLREASGNEQFSKKRRLEVSGAEALRIHPASEKDRHTLKHDLQTEQRGLSASEERPQPHCRLQTLLEGPVSSRSELTPTKAAASESSVYERPENEVGQALLPQARSMPLHQSENQEFSLSSPAAYGNVCGDLCQPQLPRTSGDLYQQRCSHDPKAVVHPLVSGKVIRRASPAKTCDTQVSRNSIRPLSTDQTHKTPTLQPTVREDYPSSTGTKHLMDVSNQHRQVNERAKSPPGFWRAEMPSTQEERLHRVIAMSTRP